MPNPRGGAANGLDTWAGVSMQVSDRLLARQNKVRSERKEGQVKGERGRSRAGGATLYTLPSSQPET